MQTELVVKDWHVEERDGKNVITGSYAVCLDGNEIATSSFNGTFGGAQISFNKEVQASINALCVSINEAIKDSFTN